mmetsp:Transcript_56784/g.172885  ORF Transcript_56784/g.172885 Transcript_56784/m.172885 type:complete len:280 (-) Transcript_56784:2-841(-)
MRLPFRHGPLTLSSSASAKRCRARPAHSAAGDRSGPWSPRAAAGCEALLAERDAGGGAGTSANAAGGSATAGTAVIVGGVDGRDDGEERLAERPRTGRAGGCACFGELTLHTDRAGEDAPERDPPQEGEPFDKRDDADVGVSHPGHLLTSQGSAFSGRPKGRTCLSSMLTVLRLWERHFSTDSRRSCVRAESGVFNGVCSPSWSVPQAASAVLLGVAGLSKLASLKPCRWRRGFFKASGEAGRSRAACAMCAPSILEHDLTLVNAIMVASAERFPAQPI